MRCRTTIIRSSALVQASTSLSMGRTRSVATELTHHRNLFSPFSPRALASRAILPSRLPADCISPILVRKVVVGVNLATAISRRLLRFLEFLCQSFSFGALRLLSVKCLRLALLLTSLSHLRPPIFLQLSEVLGCRTHKAWGLSQGCCVMPR